MRRAAPPAFPSLLPAAGPSARADSVLARPSRSPTHRHRRRYVGRPHKRRCLPWRCRSRRFPAGGGATPYRFRAARGFAVCRDSTSSKVMPDGSAVVVDPDRQRAGNPAAHSPVDTRTAPLNTGEAAERRRSNVSTASSTLSAARTSCSPAALRRSPPGRRSNKVGPPEVASNAANRRAMVGWLSFRASAVPCWNCASCAFFHALSSCAGYVSHCLSTSG